MTKVTLTLSPLLVGSFVIIGSSKAGRDHAYPTRTPGTRSTPCGIGEDECDRPCVPVRQRRGVEQGGITDRVEDGILRVDGVTAGTGPVRRPVLDHRRGGPP